MDDVEKAPSVAIVRPGKLFWIAVWLVLVAVVAIYGWPHMLWNFTYRGDWDHRYYTQCLYLGRFTQTVYPSDGRCPYVLFFKGNVDG